MRVLITGATGFLGYHITKACLDAGHDVLCLRRSTSKNPFSPEYADRITWFELDAADATNVVASFAPDALIHAAWEGVDSASRLDELMQQRNIDLSRRLYALYRYPQMITIGSQDEYGHIESIVTEDTPVKPISAYARAKVFCCTLQQQYAVQYAAEWQWIRLFGTYGPLQQDNWVIPSVMRQCIADVPIIETTQGEQQYSFLYAADFGQAIVSILGSRGKSAIYNLASSCAITLSDLFELIQTITGSKSLFSKTLPYRPNQSMKVMGDVARFIASFGPYEKTSLRDGLVALFHSINPSNESK